MSRQPVDKPVTDHDKLAVFGWWKEHIARCGCGEPPCPVGRLILDAANGLENLEKADEDDGAADAAGHGADGDHPLRDHHPRVLGEHLADHRLPAGDSGDLARAEGGEVSRFLYQQVPDGMTEAEAAIAYDEWLASFSTAEDRIMMMCRESRHVMNWFPPYSSGAGDMIEDLMNDLRECWGLPRREVADWWWNRKEGER
jgi:hypothetical protein